MTSNFKSAVTVTFIFRGSMPRYYTFSSRHTSKVTQHPTSIPLQLKLNFITTTKFLASSLSLNLTALM